MLVLTVYDPTSPQPKKSRHNGWLPKKDSLKERRQNALYPRIDTPFTSPVYAYLMLCVLPQFCWLSKGA